MTRLPQSTKRAPFVAVLGLACAGLLALVPLLKLKLVSLAEITRRLPSSTDQPRSSLTPWRAAGQQHATFLV